MKRSILTATAVAVAFGIAVGGLGGCVNIEQSNIPQSASMEADRSSSATSS